MSRESIQPWRHLRQEKADRALDKVEAHPPRKVGKPKLCKVHKGPHVFDGVSKHPYISFFTRVCKCGKKGTYYWPCNKCGVETSSLNHCT